MTGERRLLLAATASLLVESASALLLLAVSVWFISACAVAGQVGVAAGFNYLAPATVIRILAILRIAAGYADRYLGHLLLLRRLARRRHALLHAVFASREGPEHARAASTLQQASEDWAARYSSVLAPQLAAAVLFAGLLLFVGLLLPALAQPLLVLAAFLLCLRFLLVRAADLRVLDQEHCAARLDRELDSWLRSSSLWSLRARWRDPSQLQSVAAAYGAARRRVAKLAAQGEDVLLVSGLLSAVVLYAIAAGIEATPMATVPILLAAALRDWLRPAMVAVLRGRETQQRCRAMFYAYAPPGAANTAQVGAETVRGHGASVPCLELEAFRWRRGERRAAPLSACLRGPGLYLLTGSSGVGKSSLFQAMAGELDYEGSAMVDGAELRDLSPAQRVGLVYLAEQFTRVLSDTLAHNLRLAAPDASDEALQSALRWSEFAEDTDLRQWVGEQGRPLSGGERKRLSLARARLSSAPLWLLDEPFEGMDAALAARIGDRLHEAAQTRLILIASHRVPATLHPRAVIDCPAPDPGGVLLVDGQR
ncbi:MAG: ATP-binding cassette domain-containing protein [Halieaceae bacterium]|jgi:ATP-binding cassette subfamily C protein CydC|nr:ATP-binding cassette domain-containing protein [Halieaceae bacterium]